MLPTRKTTRCWWAGDDPLYVAYHDEEWGVPVHDDRKLFEMLILEGAQAGLSWITILRKRDAYRKAFAGSKPSNALRYPSRRRRMVSQESPACAPSRISISNSRRSSCTGTPHSSS